MKTVKRCIPAHWSGTEETYALIDRIKKQVELCNYLFGVYCYLCNDTANFGTMMLNFTNFFMHCKSRGKTELATCAAVFCSSADVKEMLEDANLNKDSEGVNLRPRVSQVPVVLKDSVAKKPYIARRLYFGRLMDFFVTEWFEGMAQGHYLWQCCVCGRYFLMTTAHRQLYCKNLKPEYGTTCDHVANNRRLGKEKGADAAEEKGQSPVDYPQQTVCVHTQKQKPRQIQRGRIRRGKATFGCVLSTSGGRCRVCRRTLYRRYKA